MSTRSALLKLLTDHAGEYVSGEKVGEILGVSRNAVSKACAALRADGYDIVSRTNKGYMLEKNCNVLTEDGIRAFTRVPCRIKVYDVTGSTNELAKTASLEKGVPDDFDRSDLKGPDPKDLAHTDLEKGIRPVPVVIIADKQTAGKGRLGRRFESPAGTGLYMSFVFKPDFDISKSLFVTMASAVGTCRAIEKVTGKHSEIKWVNDLFYNGKKICGILTEAQSDFETSTIDRLITGVGVNCFPGSFPPEISQIAGSLSDEPDSFSREKLAGEMINQILPLITRPDLSSFMDEYKERCFILGREITIHPAYDDSGIRAKALGISDDGGLIVEYLEDAKASDMIAAAGSAAETLRKAKAGAEDVLHTGEISVSI